MNKMNKEEALNILKQVGSAFNGTLQAHQTIQTALSYIEHELVEKPKPVEKKEEPTEIVKD